jgi:hypothetical protein
LHALKSVVGPEACGLPHNTGQGEADGAYKRNHVLQVGSLRKGCRTEPLNRARRSRKLKRRCRAVKTKKLDHGLCGAAHIADTQLGFSKPELFFQLNENKHAVVIKIVNPLKINRYGFRGCIVCCGSKPGKHRSGILSIDTAGKLGGNAAGPVPGEFNGVCWRRAWLCHGSCF